MDQFGFEGLSDKAVVTLYYAAVTEYMGCHEQREEDHEYILEIEKEILNRMKNGSGGGT